MKIALKIKANQVQRNYIFYMQTRDANIIHFGHLTIKNLDVMLYIKLYLGMGMIYKSN